LIFWVESKRRNGGDRQRSCNDSIKKERLLLLEITKAAALRLSSGDKIKPPKVKFWQIAFASPV